MAGATRPPFATGCRRRLLGVLLRLLLRSRDDAVYRLAPNRPITGIVPVQPRDVGPRPAVEDVDAVVVRQGVQDVVAGAAQLAIGAGAPPDRVVPLPAVDEVVATTAVQPVRAGPAVDVVASIAGLDRVVARPRVDRIPDGRAAERVRTGRADDQLRGGRTGESERRNCRDEQQLSLHSRHLL